MPSESWDEARGFTGRRDAKRIGEDVRGTTGCRCGDKPGAHEKAQYGSSGTTPSVTTPSRRRCARTPNHAMKRTPRDSIMSLFVA